MIAADDTRPATCTACGADPMSCGVKSGLSGRRCCDDCVHVETGDPSSAPVRRSAPSDAERRHD